MVARLSKSSLDEFSRCARCWWLAKRHKLKAPEGIRAGVPLGIDRVLKQHYDTHRAAGTVPPELVGQIPGALYDGKRITMPDLRNWRKGLTVAVGPYELSTALDDLLYDAARHCYNMIDYKSKAKETNTEDTQKYYQTQADAYDLALNVNDYPTNGVAYFAYYAPDAVDGGGDGAVIPFRWQAQVIPIKTDHARIKALVMRAGKCLEDGLPPHNVECEMCEYTRKRDSFLVADG